MTIVLYNCKLLPKYLLPGCANYNLITADKAVPKTPQEPPNIKYKIPICL